MFEKEEREAGFAIIIMAIRLLLVGMGEKTELVSCIMPLKANYRFVISNNCSLLIGLYLFYNMKKILWDLLSLIMDLKRRTFKKNS